MINVEVTQKDDIHLLSVSGEVDLYSSPEVRTALLELTREKPAAIIVQFDQVTYIDSSGLATLIEGLQEVNQYNGKFILTGLRQEVMGVFQLSRLDEVFEIYPSLEEALKAVGDDGTGQ